MHTAKICLILVAMPGYMDVAMQGYMEQIPRSHNVFYNLVSHVTRHPVAFSYDTLSTKVRDAGKKNSPQDSGRLN